MARRYSRRMRWRATPALLGVWLVHGGVLATDVPGDDALGPSAELVAAGRISEALVQVETLFERGYPTPSRLQADPRFAALRDDPAGREAMRELLRDHVRESRITIVAAEEPGTPMLIRGHVREPDGTAVAGAVVYLFHTDATGLYAPGTAVGRGSNPRLFGFVKTDPAGDFEVRTIQPAPYPGASAGAAHVHYVVEADGRARQSDEFRPYTWPADAALRDAAAGRPFSVVSEESGLRICEVTIPIGSSSR